MDVVGYVGVVGGELLLDDGVAAALDVDHVGVVHDGLHVAAGGGSAGKGGYAVQPGCDLRIVLDGADEAGQISCEAIEEFGL